MERTPGSFSASERKKYERKPGPASGAYSKSLRTYGALFNVNCSGRTLLQTAAYSLLFIAQLMSLPAGFMECCPGAHTIVFPADAMAEDIDPDLLLMPPVDEDGLAASSCPPFMLVQDLPPVPLSVDLSSQTTATVLQSIQPPETTLFDILHGLISRSFLSTATWFDSFFGDERYESETNMSRLKVRYDAFRERGARTDFQPQIDLRMVLPQLRKKTYLVVSGDATDLNDPLLPKAPKTTDPLLKPIDQKINTSIQYFISASEQVSFSVRTGIRLSKGKPEMFLGPRYRYLIPFDPWAFRFTEDVVWDTEKGWLSRTRFDLERPLNDAFFFRTSAEGVWVPQVNGYPYSLSMMLMQSLSHKQALEYEWVNTFQTRPMDKLDEVLFRVRYRTRIWRDWLYFEVAPQYRFPRDRSFDHTPGILFRLEAIFGEYKSM